MYIGAVAYRYLAWGFWRAVCLPEEMLSVSEERGFLRPRHPLACTRPPPAGCLPGHDCQLPPRHLAVHRDLVQHLHQQALALGGRAGTGRSAQQRHPAHPHRLGQGRSAADQVVESPGRSLRHKKLSSGKCAPLCVGDCSGCELGTRQCDPRRLVRHILAAARGTRCPLPLAAALAMLFGGREDCCVHSHRPQQPEEDGDSTRLCGLPAGR